MSSNVEPEEAQAILDAVAPQPGEGGAGAQPAPGARFVAARDFAQPLRLSTSELERFAQRLQRALPAVEQTFGLALRRRHALELAEVRETSVEGLFRELTPPLAVLAFQVAGQPGWILWESRPAVAAMEVALGAGEPSAETERALSSVERSTLARLMQVLLDAVGTAVGVKPQELRVVTKLEDLGSWRGGGERAGPERLSVQLDFDGPGAPSRLRIYLPGVEGEARESTRQPPAAPPEHLESIELTLTVSLGSNEIPLAELLTLEVGDVIPLGVSVDDPVRVLIESEPWAEARLGGHGGMLAVRLEDSAPLPTDPTTPRARQDR